jgi:DNA polymerase III delta subunit
VVTYAQWSVKKKIAPINWIFGTETKLIEEVVQFIKLSVNPAEIDYCVLDAKVDKEVDIWSTLRQHSIQDDSPRLVLVNHAEDLTALEPLRLWNLEHRKTLPNTRAVFVSSKEPAFPISAPNGSTVKCEISNPKDLINWVKSNSCLAETSVKLVLEHTNGNLTDTFNLCRKIQLSFPEASNLSLTKDLIASLDDETPTDFVDALFNRDKSRALKAAESLSKDGINSTLAYVEYKLKQLEMFKEEIAHIVGYVKLNEVPGFSFIAAKELMPLSKMYDVRKLMHCRQALVLMSSYAGQSITEGLLETLVLLW